MATSSSAATSSAFLTTPSPMRRRTTVATTSTFTSTSTSTSTSTTTPRGRSSDNAVDYTLSGAHSSMDIVLEEMTIWMLNANKLNCLAVCKNQE
ncbi:hypothetical protein M5D96_000327 [Drosophila gunungcola]|uniref:Uncharacterized protein n=1 Tax=Drosophila gunungcola TaxID=103775 RepID=A0A9P9YW50_9MUSC|nr:hypothetical protein M5D96_000327 [Drosophila gunungcola]